MSDAPRRAGEDVLGRRAPGRAGEDALERAREVLRMEAEAVGALAGRIGSPFREAVDRILACAGRVVVTGMGKSGLVGQKIASTLASTGTPALCLHPADGVHGDVGMLTRSDLVLAVSHSGETEELLRLVPAIRRLGLPLIALTGAPHSTLAGLADVTIDVSVEREACPMGLAPTSSTTAALAMGDALAVALFSERGFDEEEFALLHPGGTLGRRLFTRVADLMHEGEAVPLVPSGVPVREALFEITRKRLGITGVTDAAGALVGAFSDGDLRRALEADARALERPIDEFMSRDPKRILDTALAAKALRRMEDHAITSLFVFRSDEDPAPAGIVHLHDLLRAGVA